MKDCAIDWFAFLLPQIDHKLSSLLQIIEASPANSFSQDLENSVVAQIAQGGINQYDTSGNTLLHAAWYLFSWKSYCKGKVMPEICYWSSG